MQSKEGNSMQEDYDDTMSKDMRNDQKYEDKDSQKDVVIVQSSEAPSQKWHADANENKKSSGILNNQGYIDTLRYLITDIVKDGKIHNSAELMQKLKDNFPSLMRDFKIADRYFLFSIIEALFPNEFSLRRPFFAKKGIVIENQKERLIEFVREKGSVDISEFMGYIYSNKFVAPTIFGVVNGIIDQVFILDNNTLIDSELINIDESIITLIENALPSILNKIGCIIEGADFSSLPPINNTWTEWLLYSVVKKYSKQYTTSTTDNAFAQARPIFIKQ